LEIIFLSFLNFSWFVILPVTAEAAPLAGEARYNSDSELPILPGSFYCRRNTDFAGGKKSHMRTHAWPAPGLQRIAPDSMRCDRISSGSNPDNLIEAG